MNFVKTVLAVLVAQFLLMFTVVFGLGMLSTLFSRSEGVHVAKGSYLVMDIYGDIPPYDAPESISSSIFKEGETLTRVLDNLDKAAADKRIDGVIMKISSSNSLGMASLGEVRDAIERIKKSGKEVLAYSDSMDRNALYLASACDSIYMPEVADVAFTGFGSVDMFAKGTLDKLDVHQNLHKIRDYKTAAETFQRSDMSPQAKEMAGWMIDEMWNVELGAIARDRALSVDSLSACMKHALFTADEAKAAGLIDDVLYWDQLEDRLGGDDFESVDEETYDDVTRADVGLKGKHRIAVVHAYGMIGGRESRTDASLGVLIGHETVVQNLRDAEDDDRVSAIILRVDSPGGESLASELISREVGRIAKKKPVIVSMGDVAASGGYAVSYRATKIVADSLTITGSIGSIFGKMNVAGLWKKGGITFDYVTKGANALLFSSITDFDASQWSRVETFHDASFERWLRDISAARKIPMDELRPLTDGRVWTGRQAVANHLIDDTGGYQRAVEVAKEAAGIPADEQVTFEHFPKKQGLISLLTSGNAPITLARMAINQFMHTDVSETKQLLHGGELRLFTGSYR
ncbi:MAG TPA: signal peptide peptidase SppA [Candidatus Krumholzibacteria bacterium]|nr:signal peptide peptidase SppA [Candidatus Krumholzibacteria bacterium]